jgi:FtsP/CotA-like multicopper oxidase with cupredoxin domain
MTGPSRREVLGAALAVAAPLPEARGGPGRVLTPDGETLTGRAVNGARVFHLVAAPATHEVLEGLSVQAWAYNGRVPGPTLEVTQGERCRIYVTNELPEPTSIHWHGVLVPNGMDGVGGLTQPPIPPGETFLYEFAFDRPGTFLYHPHIDEMTQIGLGLMGLIVVHPRRPGGPRVDRDYALLLSEFLVRAGAGRAETVEPSDFNVLTINGRSYPGTTPLVARSGERVRIRIGNLSPMDHHPIHLHGHVFEVAATNGGPVPPAAREPQTSVLVPVGDVRTIEFVAGAPGDWAMHCHMTHHMMNQMGHARPVMVGAAIPAELESRLRRLVPGYMSMGTAGMADMGAMEMPVPENSVPMKVGPGPFGHFDLGGMTTLLKVRARLPASGDVGWYAHPPGTVARAATADELRADGVTPGSRGGP